MQTANIAAATEKISKANVQLIQNNAFFGCLALGLRFIPADVKTCVTDGVTVQYSPEYFNSLSVDELQGVIAHEVMHLALLHHTRRDHRDLKKWNQACDLAVNPMLKEAKFALPPGAPMDDAYNGLSAEQIYSKLPDPPPEDNDSEGQDNPGIGDFQDPPPDMNVQEMEAEMKEAVAMATMMAQREGGLPDGMARSIDKVLNPKVDWQEALTRFITEIVRNDYTWSKPATRYLHVPLFLPTLESLEPGQVIFMVDTSGSIDDNILNQVATEAKDVADTFQIDLSVMYIDALFQGIQYFDRGDPIVLEPKGGGGTDFRPGFDYLYEQDIQPKAVIYLTDGYCSSFPEEPDFPVLWTLFNNTNFDPPFGEVLIIE